MLNGDPIPFVSFAAIPIYIDRWVNSVTYIQPTKTFWGGQFCVPPEWTRGFLVGSMPAWGALIAYNIAAAYRPEGVPSWGEPFSPLS